MAKKRENMTWDETLCENMWVLSLILWDERVFYYYFFLKYS